ncbi:MAG: TetR/AcrR family transcriptional regulator [candidate division Zixibacteria bacterium]|nr:TetR/AcrR family transcriptional regulator [candidate division Zixibacteria bacterium]
MSRSLRMERERNNRIEDIIDTAEQLFFSKGYEHVTVDEIAKKAEFSKSTLYTYFESKEEIFLLVHLKGLKKRWQVTEAMKTKKNGIDKLRIFGEEYYKFYKKYPEYLRLQLYWSTYGINFDKISKSSIKMFEEENKRSLDIVKQTFQMELLNSKHPSAENIERLVSYFYETLRIILNKSLFPIDPFHRYNNKEYYFRFLDMFLLSVKTMSNNDY